MRKIYCNSLKNWRKCSQNWIAVKKALKRRKERETIYIVIVIICLFYKSITINSYKIIRRQMGNSTFVVLEVRKSQKDNLMRVNMPPWRPSKSDAIVVTCPMNQYRQPLSRTAHAGRRMGRRLERSFVLPNVLPTCIFYNALGRLMTYSFYVSPWWSPNLILRFIMEFLMMRKGGGNWT